LCTTIENQPHLFLSKEEPSNDPPPGIREPLEAEGLPIQRYNSGCNVGKRRPRLEIQPLYDALRAQPKV